MSVPNMTMAPAPPPSPTPGDFWWNTATGFLFIFYDDGTSQQWVVANPGQGSVVGPPGLPGIVTTIQAGDGITVSPPGGSASTVVVSVAPTHAFAAVNNAAVRSISSTFPAVVITSGRTTAGDAGGGIWWWNSASVAADDNATVLKPSSIVSSGRYIRVIEESLRPEIWGAVGDGVTDDLAAFNAAETFMGTLAKMVPLHCPRRYLLSDTFYFKNITVIDGLGTGEFIASSGFNKDGSLLQYHGSSTPTLQNCKGTCFIPITLAQPASGGGGLFCVVPDSGMASGAIVRNVQTVGGTARPFHFHQVSNVIMKDVSIDRCFGVGVDIVCTQDTPLIMVRNYDIDIKTRMTGAMSIGLPENGSDVARRSSDNVRIRLHVDGGGWLSGQAALTPVGCSLGQYWCKVTGRNHSTGLVSVKKNVEFTTPVPSRVGNIVIESDYITEIDQGANVNYSHDEVTLPYITDSQRNCTIKGSCIFDGAAPWQPNTHYEPGDGIVSTTAASTTLSYFVCQIGGKSGAVAGPTLTGVPIGTPTPADNEIIWLYAGDVTLVSGSTPISTNVFGVRHKGTQRDVVIDMLVQKICGCMSLIANQSGGDTFTNITATFRGSAMASVLTDDNTLGNITADRIRFVGCSVHVYGLFLGNKSHFLIGSANGGHTTTYTNLTIDGGIWSNDAQQPWFNLISNTCNISGRIVGAPHVYCGGSLMILRGTCNIEWAGGGHVVIHDQNSNPINTAGTPVSIAFTMYDPVFLSTNASDTSANFKAWVPTASCTFNTRFCRGYLASSPTGAKSGALGDFYLSSAPAAGTIGWVCTTAATATATYGAF